MPQPPFRRSVPLAALFLLVACGSQSIESPPPPAPIPAQAQEIVNGKDTTITENPWQVFIYVLKGPQDETIELCGGSILNEWWILTAQHCVRDKQKNNSLVAPESVFPVAGITYRVPRNAGQERRVAEIIPYPGFVATTQGKDVALLRLATPLDLSGPDAQVITLATQADEASGITNEGVVARATGWGSRGPNDQIGTNTLQSTELILQTNSEAQLFYPQYTITPDQLSAFKKGTSTCMGDSGGPLSVERDGVRVQVGVTSWGNEFCDASSSPPMFARVASFQPWIQEKATCTLANDTTTSGISVGPDQWTCTYTLSVPEGASNLTFELSGGTGDGDLYVSFGTEPTTQLADCAPYLWGNQETCSFPAPHAGTYYVRIRGYSPASGMSLKSRYFPRLDFGGMWGYVDNDRLSPNPATGKASCPEGYTPTRMLGTAGRDRDVFLCSRPHQEGREPLYDFGGMWGYVLGSLMPNPYTFRDACPEGYAGQTVFASLDRENAAIFDYEIHACYKLHVAGRAPDFPFGGMMGQVDSGVPVLNPATGADWCPAGFVSQPVSGMPNVDWTLQFCYQPPTRWDFGGIWGYGNNKQLFPNPATHAASCPAGYTATQLLGSDGVDWGLFMCSRPHLESTGTYLDFGGMWGTVNHFLKPNPFTHAVSCPTGYTQAQVLGSDVDYPVALCSRPHYPMSEVKYPFGGMWGQVNGGRYVPNPTTGGLSCPAGFTDVQVLGTYGKDYELHFCAYNP